MSIHNTSTTVVHRAFRKATALLMLLALTLTPTFAAAQTTYYVDGATGSDMNAGTSWGTAFATLTEALAQAGSTDEIWIAEGTYTPGSNRGDSFTITGTQDGLKIYGGFANGDAFADRDPSDHPTVLSGDLDQNDGPDTNGDGLPDSGRAENAYHVLVFDGGNAIGTNVSENITGATMLNGVTVTGGNANKDTFPDRFPDDAGGGLFCDGQGSGNECSLQITDVTFTGNSATNGGAIYNDGTRGGTSSPQIKNTIFTGNTAFSTSGVLDGEGGAIQNNAFEGRSSPQITNTIFTGNSAEDGGAIYTGAEDGTSNLVATNVTFTGNSAKYGGAMHTFYVSSSEGEPQIVNATFTENSANEGGGAIYNLSFGGTLNLQIKNTVLWANSATDGNEIFNDSASNTTLTHTLIEGGVNGPGVDGGPNTDGENNLKADPLFVDAGQPAGPDGTFGTEDDGLRLLAGSPALNVGDNNAVPSGISTDLLGEDRIQNGTVSLGAYEREVIAFYVDANAAGANNGMSFSDAFTDLQDALDIAMGDNVIVVAEGTYTPSTRLDAGDARTATFEVTGEQNGLKIYGGWRGSESFSDIPDVESQLDSRNLSANETILSGDIGTPSDASDNAYHVVVFNGGNRIGDNTAPNTTTGTELNGVTVTRGNANESSDPNSQGGGIFCDGGSSGNECSPTLANIIFSQNAASEEGGALFNDAFLGTSSPHVINSTFTSNSATFGAAIAGEVSNGESNPVIRSATFDGNIAQTSGGAIYIDGNFGTGKPEIENATFTNNEADFGGAIYFYGASGEAAPQITNATFVNNTATSQGGAFYFFGDGGSIAAEIVNSIFAGNGADHIAFDDGNANESPTFINSTFTGATDFIFDIQYFDSGQTPIAVVNSVLWDNGGIAGTTLSVSDPSAAVEATYSIVEEAAYEDGSGDANAGTGNLYADPLFVDAGQPAGNDGTLATEDDGLRLAGNSPAVDAGDNSAVPGSISTDLLGNPRIQDGTVSLGAYETPGLPVATGVTITGADGTGTDTGWRIVSVPYTGAVAGDLRMRHSAGTNAPRFDQNVVAVWDDGDPDGGTVGTGAYTIANASTPLPNGSAALVYLQDNTRDPVDPSGLTISLSESTAATRQGIRPVVRNELARSARWHLLGNPYPTGYALASLQSNGQPLVDEGFQNDGQIYDVTVPGGAGWRFIDTSRDDLSAWQGMFIERTQPGSGASSVTFGADGRTADVPFIGTLMTGPSETASTSETPNRAMLQFALTAQDGEAAPIARDEAIGIRFHEDARDGFDPYDTSKMSPLETPYAMAMPLGIGRAGNEVGKAVESRPYLQADDPLVTIPVQLSTAEVPSTAMLTFAVHTYDLPAEWAAEVVDTKGTAASDDDRVVPLGPNHEIEIALSDLQDYGTETAPLHVQVAPSQEALPVELAGFDAQRSGNEAITLQWETRSETNNAGFEVQRRAGSNSASRSNVGTPQWDVSTGEAWQTVARLDGAGTTDTPQSYRFEDTQLPYAADSLRYRLRQIDTDGTESFSEPVTVARQVTEAELLPTYPNPARSQATVRYAVPNPQDVRIVLYDMLGRRVRTVVDTQATGRTEQPIDVSRLASGTYFLRMRTNGGIVDTQRVTIIR